MATIPVIQKGFNRSGSLRDQFGRDTGTHLTRSIPGAKIGFLPERSTNRAARAFYHFSTQFNDSGCYVQLRNELENEKSTNKTIQDDTEQNGEGWLSANFKTGALTLVAGSRGDSRADEAGAAPREGASFGRIRKNNAATTESISAPLRLSFRPPGAHP
jgi:hypothetical protein